MEKGMVFDIQKYSIHDGGGIRTIVFLKGCPLRCPWCSNPESINFKQEIMRKESLCIQCSSSSCMSCTSDPEDCPTGALQVVGKEMTVKEVIAEVKKDEVFYESSGGGVTLSGGEPLAQGEFAAALLKRCKELGFDTALETSGNGEWSILDEMSDYLNRVLFDLKIMEEEKAEKIVGADIKLIKSNLKKLVEKNVEVIPRIPLIPGCTMTDGNIESIIQLILSLELKEAHILPFHQYGSSKYENLGRNYELKDLSPPTDEEVEIIQDKMLTAGLERVIIGGE